MFSYQAELKMRLARYGFLPLYLNLEINGTDFPFFLQLITREKGMHLAKWTAHSWLIVGGGVSRDKAVGPPSWMLLYLSELTPPALGSACIWWGMTSSWKKVRVPLVNKTLYLYQPAFTTQWRASRTIFFFAALFDIPVKAKWTFQ